MTLKEEGCSECKFSLKIGCSKLLANTALSYFTKLGMYWDEEITGRPEFTSAIDDFTVKFCFFFG